ncbi:MAG: sortase [Clostridia bacterium]|nr:sortase [Clostridia bacterium]
MKERKKKKRKIILNLIICMILGIFVWLCMEEQEDLKIRKKEIINMEYKTDLISIQKNNNGENNTKNVKTYPKEEIIREYKGYEVAAKIQIPKIELETYILKNYSIKALKICVTKFWGADANKIGNFCVAGHNYKNKNMFQNLKELEIGDRFYISDNTVGKVEYEVYDIYIVEPEDISCLSQETNNKREVTLITCTNDTTKRIIVKAREVEI